MQELITNAPNALLVVAKIIPRDETASAWAVPSMDEYNTATEGLVANFASKGKHVIGVDMSTGFPSSELADGIHPNPKGYARMANVWYTAIGKFLPL